MFMLWEIHLPISSLCSCPSISSFDFDFDFDNPRLNNIFNGPAPGMAIAGPL